MLAELSVLQQVVYLIFFVLAPVEILFGFMYYSKLEKSKYKDTVFYAILSFFVISLSFAFRSFDIIRPLVNNSRIILFGHSLYLVFIVLAMIYSYKMLDLSEKYGVKDKIRRKKL